MHFIAGFSEPLALPSLRHVFLPFPVSLPSRAYRVEGPVVCLDAATRIVRCLCAARGCSGQYSHLPIPRVSARY